MSHGVVRVGGNGGVVASPWPRLRLDIPVVGAEGVVGDGLGVAVAVGGVEEGWISLGSSQSSAADLRSASEERREVLRYSPQ